MAEASTQILNNNRSNEHLKITEKTAEEIVEYLRRYYIEEQGWGDREDWYIVLFRRPEGGKQSFYFTIRELKEEPEKIKNWIMKNLEKYNIYHSIFIYKEKQRKEKYALKESRVTYIDLDKGEHQTITMKELNTKIAPLLEEKLKKRGIPYTVIHSGRGIHIKILLNTPLKEGEYKRLSALAELFEGTDCKADNIYDFARIIRIPWSINQESKQQAKIIYQTDETAKKEVIIKLIEELEEKKKAKTRTEKQYEEEEVVDLEEEKLDSIAKEIYLIIKDYYAIGTRHNLLFFTLATIYKYTRITEEQLYYITEELINLLSDEEYKQRMSIVKSITKKAEEEGRDKIATVSFFFIQNDKGELLEDRRLSQFASANKIELSEAKDVIIKLKNDIIELLKKHGQTYNRKFLGRVRISNKGRIMDVEVYRDSIALAWYKKNDEGDQLVGREYFIKARIILKEVIVKRNDMKKTSEWLYTVKIQSEYTNEEFRQAPLRRIAEYLYGSPLVRMKSKQQIETILQAVFDILIRYYRIKITKVSEVFEVEWNEEKKKYTHNATEFYNETYSVSDVRNYQEKVSEEDIEKALEVFNRIRDDKLFAVVSGALFSSFFNNELRLKPLIWVWSKEPGLGKSTLMEFISEKLFAIKKLSIQEAKSNFRIVSALSLATLPIVLDDVSSREIDNNLRDFIKSYLTGVKSISRGRADLSTVSIDLRATLFVTSNTRFVTNDEAFKDRIIQIKLSNEEEKAYVFTDEETIDLIEEITGGTGYYMLDEVLSIMNQYKMTFSEYAKMYYKKMRDVLTDIHSRRLKLYSQIWQGLILLRVIAEKHNKMELVKRIDRVLENTANLIGEIESQQDDVSEMLIYVDDMLEKLENSSFIKKTEDGELIVTSSALKILRENNTLFEEIKSLRELERVINSKYNDVARVKTVRIKGKVIKALVVNLSKATRMRGVDEEELREEVYQLLKELKNEKSISFDRFIALLLTRISVNDEEEVAERVKELLLTKFRRHIELMGTELSSVLKNSEVPVFKVKRI
ncbi:hypothetical protein [Thermococcus thermotolerans]|uniref:hypothetical protein n=1 Tax=Thermococcus thermotolerans TaxID=2969672 RepID=UPI0021570AE4|nr:hypothetical protein [Thermococcus thermotolerans]